MINTWHLVVLKIVPAELMFALHTSHVVAATVFDNYDLAVRTVFASLASLPDLEDSLLIRLSAFVHIFSHRSAAHTNFCSTLAFRSFAL